MSLQFLSVQQQGIETDGSGYPTLVNCATAQSAVQAHSGTKSLTLTSSAAGDMTANSANFAVMPGRSYSFSGWVRTQTSARTAGVRLLWKMSDGATNSLIRATDDLTITDATGSWTQATGVAVVAPSDAYFVQMSLRVVATGAGAEVHYFDDMSLIDTGSYFKHGRLANLYLNEVDVSSYFASADMNLKVQTAPVTTFTASWESFLAGLASGSLTAAGYYDSLEADNVRETLLEAPANAGPGQLTYFPAGGIAIGDQARLIQYNSTDYKSGSKIGSAVTMDWTALSTSPVGLGVCLHVLQSEAPGTITGIGDPVLTGVQSTTGAIAHLHVTAATGGDSHAFKLQDSATLNGAYADITSGAFTNTTAIGSQRLVIPGTIRAFVRAVAVIATHAATYSITVART